jgi:hypothetical protein
LKSSLLPGATSGKRQRDKAGPEGTKESRI